MAADPLLKRALEMREKTLGPDHPDVAESLSNLRYLYTKKGLYDKGIAAYENVIEIDPNNSRAYGRIGCTYYLMNEFQKCIE